MTHSSSGLATAPEHVLLRATRGRGSRQLLVVAIALPLFLAMLWLGVAILVFGWQYGWRSAGFWIGGFFGWMFVLLAIACLVSVVEVIGRTVLTRPGTPVLEVDSRGIGDGRHAPTAWADLTRVVVISAAPTFRRNVKGRMDRAIGEPLKIRDGQRAIRLHRRDGKSPNIHLTLPIGPEEFASSWPVIEALGQWTGVPVEFTDDLSRRFS